MRLILILPVMLAFNLVMALDEWPIPHNIGYTGFSPTTVLKPPLKVKWAAHVLGFISGESGNGPVVAEGKVVIQGLSHNVICLDAETGELLWRTSVPESPYYWHYFPCIADGKVYLVFSVKGNPAVTGIRCLNLATGDLLWKKDAGHISSFRKKESPQYSKGKVFLHSIRDVNQSTLAQNNYKYVPQVQAWNAVTGDTLWTYTMGDSIPLDQYGNPGDPNNSLCVVGDTIFASYGAGTKGKTVALDLNGNVLWSSTQYYVDAYAGSIQYTGNELLIPGVYCCSDGFYALNPRNGNLIYRIAGPTSYSKISAVMNGKAWNRPYGGAPGSFNVSTGAGNGTGCKLPVNDEYNSGCAAPRAANGYIYAGLGNPSPANPLAAGHTLFAWNEAGNPVWWFRTELNVCQDVAIAYDRLFWLTFGSGMIYCFENDNRTVTSLKAFCVPETLEQYSSGTVKSVISFSDGTKDTTNMSCYFSSLDPFAAVVTVEGKTVTAKNTGSVRIRIEQYGRADTLTIPIKPASAVLDSIKLTHSNITLGVGESLLVSATGYFHSSTNSFSAVIDTFATWTSDSVQVATVANGLIKGLRSGGPSTITAAYKGKSAGLLIKVKTLPAFLKRINFQVSATPFKIGWLASNGAAYSAGLGYGWVNGVGATRDDRGGSNFLLKSFVIGLPGLFKLDAPDGDYVLRIGMGDNGYGTGSYNWVVLGSDTLCRKPIGIGNAVETHPIHITGGNGMTLKVDGPICYLVAASAEQGTAVLCEFADDGYDDPACGTGIRESAIVLQTKKVLAVSPNPFNPETRIIFSLEKRADITLRVCDTHGKVVRTLMSGECESGPVSVVWNGRDDAGAALSSGVYMVTAKSASGLSLCKKVTLMK